MPPLTENAYSAMIELLNVSRKTVAQTVQKNMRT